MSTVTVCIPAYRSGEDIQRTIASALDQEYGDVRVVVAIEPVDTETERSCRRFDGDDRFEFSTNDRVYGWTMNLRRLLQRVETPLFTVLPHDDCHHPDYLRALHAALREDESAVVAYADMARFGSSGERFGEKTMDIERGDANTRVTSFFLEDAEAVPWRGLTRSAVLHRAEFPSNPYSGFAAEVEWAGHLLLEGHAIRVPRPLFEKRVYGPDGANVSRGWRSRSSRQRRRLALEHHRRRMRCLARAVAGDGGQRVAVELACELAMIHRTFVMDCVDDLGAVDQELARVEEVVATADASRQPALISRVALNRMRRATLSGEHTAALSFARTAVEVDESNWRAKVALSRLLLRGGDPHAALTVAQRADSAKPRFDQIQVLLAACSERLENTA